LWQVTYTEPGADVDRFMCDIDFINKDLAVADRNQADNHVKTGCFSRPVGPQQTNDSTGLDLNGHTTHDVPFAERFMQVYRFEHVADSSLII
jgi:hypothetical protein